MAPQKGLMSSKNFILKKEKVSNREGAGTPRKWLKKRLNFRHEMLYLQDDELLDDFEPRLFQCSNATGAFCVNEITDFVQVRNSATFYQDENKYDKSGFPSLKCLKRDGNFAVFNGLSHECIMFYLQNRILFYPLLPHPHPHLSPVSKMQFCFILKQNAILPSPPPPPKLHFGIKLTKFDANFFCKSHRGFASQRSFLQKTNKRLSTCFTG